MRNLIKTTSIFIIAISICFSFGQARPVNRPAVYVWDFTTRKLAKNDLTSKFTHDFESALIQFGNYKVLERRNFDRLISQIDNEKAVINLMQLSKPTLDKLKAEKADMVIFGDVFDDKESGQFNVTITFQSFDGTKVLLKSILIPRGKVHDAQSRQKYMENLVKEISLRTSSIKRVESNGFIFELKECKISGRNVTCKFLITNNSEDRELAVYNKRGGEKSRIFDNFNNEIIANFSRLANKQGKRSAKSLLVSGLPVQSELSFENASSKATKISRLDLRCWESESDKNFTVTFRNITLEK